MSCKEICQAFGAKEDCCQDNIVIAKENGKKFTLQLPKGSTDTVCCIHVDDGLIEDQTQQKCDYWLRRCQINQRNVYQNYFVEFKGGNINHGFDQIVSTIVQVRQKGIALPKESIHGVILGNNIPSLNAGSQKLKSKFKRDHGSDLHLHSKKEVIISLK